MPLAVELFLSLPEGEVGREKLGELGTDEDGTTGALRLKRIEEAGEREGWGATTRGCVDEGTKRLIGREFE